MSPSRRSARSSAAREICSAPAVVGDVCVEPPVRRGDADVHAIRLGVLDGVGKGLRDGEVGGGLDRGRRSFRHVDRQGHGDRAAGEQRPHGRLEPAVGENRRVDPAREVAELGERLGGAEPGLGDQLPHLLRVGADVLLGHAEAHPERDEPRLGPVVQVALDPAELALLRVDRARTARLQGFDPVLAPREHDRGGDDAGERQAEGREERPEEDARSHRPHGREEAHDQQ